MIARGLSAVLLAGSSVLPLAAVTRLGESGGALFWLLPAVRRGLLANARHVLGPSSTTVERARLGRAVLRNFGRAVADLATAHRRFADDDQPMEIRGREHFEAAVARERGLIAVSLHMGCYELGSMVIARRSRTAIVYHRDPADFFEHLRSRQRRRRALDEVAIDASPFFAVELLNRLREKGAVLMAGELAAGPRGEPFPFLDGLADFSPWPARLAIASGAPILPAFTLREPSGELALHLEAPIDAAPTDEPADVMRRLVTVFERYVSRYPEQWLMVRPFWRE